MQRSSALAVLVLLAACGGTLEPLGADEDAAASDPDAAALGPDAAPGTADAAAAETLTVQFDTTANGGNYAPRNVVVVWIESGGVFHKTIGRWAAERANHLVAWVQASGQDADAVSGATRSNHTARLSVQWDFKDGAGQIVPDGTYTIRLELADQNSNTAGQNHQGTFTFEKNGTASTQTLAGGGFLNVSVEYSGR